jgi:hypothetical protein
VDEAVAAMAHCPLGSFLISSCFYAHCAPASLAVVSAEEPSAAGAGAVGGALVVAGALDAGAGAGEVALMVLGVSFLQPQTSSAHVAAHHTNFQCFLITSLLAAASAVGPVPFSICASYR